MCRRVLRHACSCTDWGRGVDHASLARAWSGDDHSHRHAPTRQGHPPPLPAETGERPQTASAKPCEHAVQDWMSLFTAIDKIQRAPWSSMRPCFEVRSQGSWAPAWPGACWCAVQDAVPLHTTTHDTTLMTDKLRNLNVSSTSIEGTSAWVCYHRAHANRIAAIWEDVFSRADDGKRLALLYLTNDIVQNRCAVVLTSCCMPGPGRLGGGCSRSGPRPCQAREGQGCAAGAAPAAARRHDELARSPLSIEIGGGRGESATPNPPNQQHTCGPRPRLPPTPPARRAAGARAPNLRRSFSGCSPARSSTS